MGIGLLDVVNNKCMMLRAHQTIGNSALKMRNKTLVEYYISVMKRYSKKLLSITDIVVTDAFSPHPRSRRACRSLASIWSAASVTTLVCITFPRRKRGVDDQGLRETRLTWQTSTSHAWIDRETTSKTLQKSSVIQKISVTLSSVIIAIIVCKILIFNTLRLQQFFANHHFQALIFCRTHVKLFNIHTILDTCLDLIALQYTCMIVMAMLAFLCLCRATM